MNKLRHQERRTNTVKQACIAEFEELYTNTGIRTSEKVKEYSIKIIIQNSTQVQEQNGSTYKQA